MHRGVVARRSIEAEDRVFDYAESIAIYLDMSEGLEKLRSYKEQPRAYRDVELMELYRIEAIADFLELLVSKIDDFFDVDDSEDRVGVFAELTDSQYKSLCEAGYGTEDSIAAATDKELLDVDGIGPVTLEKIRNSAGG